MDLPFAASLLRAWVSRRARRQPIRPLEELDLARTERVLLVLTTGLGDAILSTPVFDAVRRALPHARIGLFVRSAWAPLFQSETDLDEVIVYPGKWRRFFATLAALRRFSPQLTLVLHGNDPDILPLVYLAGSRHIVRIPTRGTRYRELLSNLTREQDQATLPDRHYIDNRLRILDSVGIAPTRTAPVLRAPQSEAVAAWLASACEGRPYVVLHPWAADSYKTWPVQQARSFLEQLGRDHPELIAIVTGAGGNREAAATLAAGLVSARSAAGAFDIAGTAALLAGARAVIAPDTGILHMAAALDVPTVGLYSPTRPDLVGQRAATAKTLTLTRPLTCTPCMEKKCPHRPATCMAQFEAAAVLAALRTCLDDQA
jgi:ADP-heptose:LPS heptosyltransferase